VASPARVPQKQSHRDTESGSRSSDLIRRLAKRIAPASQWREGRRGRSVGVNAAATGVVWTRDPDVPPRRCALLPRRGRDLDSVDSHQGVESVSPGSPSDQGLNTVRPLPGGQTRLQAPH
jgi:hypothetical protein